MMAWPVEDATPCFYAYSLTKTRLLNEAVGCASIASLGNDVIKKHEQVRKQELRQM
jgi:uncharacterized protein (DUF1015 family)